MSGYSGDTLNFIEEAAEFFISLKQNLQDYKFALDGGQIVYIADASVISLFISPSSNDSRYVSPFQKDRESPHLALTATVTAEYIFSRGLTAQRDIPCFVTPGHAHDLAGIVRALTRKAGSDDSPADVREAISELGAIHTDLSSGAIDASSAARRVIEVASKQPIIGRAFEMKDFLRLFNDDLLRPLASHREVTTEILQPDSTLVTWWQRRISSFRRHANDAKSLRRGQIDFERDCRDATSLVQTQLLNRAAIRNGIRTRYVLLTVDPAIREAYSWSYWLSQSNPTNNPLTKDDRTWYVLRHPLQYIPLANVVEMPNYVDAVDIFQQTRSILEAILEPFSIFTPHFPYTLPGTVRGLRRPIRDKGLDYLEKSRQRLLRKVAERAEAAVHSGDLKLDEWHKAFTGAALLNLPLLQRRAGSQLGIISEIFSKDREVQLTLIREQQKTLDRLQKAFVINGDVFDVQLMLSMAGSAASSIQRAPPVINLQLGALDEEPAFRAIMEGDSLGGVDLRRIQEFLEMSERHHRFSFGAVLAFRCSLWPVARELAEKALKAAPKTRAGDSNTRELQHLKAVTLRLNLRSATEFAEADWLLSDLIEFYAEENDALRRRRSMAERATLHLSGAYANRLLSKTIDGRVSADLAITDDLLRELTEDGQEVPRADIRVFRAVERQAAAAVIARALFSDLFDKAPAAGRFRPSQLGWALSLYEKESATASLPLIVQLERAMLLWFKALRAGLDSQLRRQDATRLITHVREAHDRDELTALDWAEMKEFERRIEAAHLRANA